MKIVNSILAHYNEQIDLVEILQEKVNKIMKNRDSSWHYIFRIKSKDSFALKLESGRFEPQNLEDLFACSIIVDNHRSIKNAVGFVGRYFDIVERRPKNQIFTSKPSNSFQFDDLRLYATLKQNKSMPQEYGASALYSIKFEVQIKTFLQHAWDVAIHNYTYKGDEISWAMERVVYQIKAMLEHAEMSIHDIVKIKETDAIPKKNHETAMLDKIKNFLNSEWETHQLTDDMITISKNIKTLLDEMDITIEELRRYVNIESNEKRGIYTQNLSPFFIILQSIIYRAPEKIREFLSRDDTKYRIPLPSEIDSGSLDMDSDRVIHL